LNVIGQKEFGDEQLENKKKYVSVKLLKTSKNKRNTIISEQDNKIICGF